MNGCNNIFSYIDYGFVIIRYNGCYYSDHGFAICGFVFIRSKNYPIKQPKFLTIKLLCADKSCVAQFKIYLYGLI